MALVNLYYCGHFESTINTINLSALNVGYIKSIITNYDLLIVITLKVLSCLLVAFLARLLFHMTKNTIIRHLKKIK